MRYVCKTRRYLLSLHPNIDMAAWTMGQAPDPTIKPATIDGHAMTSGLKVKHNSHTK